MSAPEKKFTILLAEDDDDDYFFFKEDVLRVCHPCELVRVKNGEEALEYLATNVPDAIFLDNHMPRREGLEVLLDIRLDDRLKEIPVVILTGSQREDERVKCSTRAMTVRKPLAANIESLREACRTLDLPLLK